MKELTESGLEKLLDKHPQGDIFDTVIAIKTRLAALTGEADAERKAALMEEIQGLQSVLQYELREGGWAGEDYINDGVFHADRS